MARWPLNVAKTKYLLLARGLTRRAGKVRRRSRAFAPIPWLTEKLTIQEEGAFVGFVTTQVLENGHERQFVAHHSRLYIPRDFSHEIE